MANEIRRLSTPNEVLAAALKKEKASYRFYDNLLKENINIEILRETIEELREEEYKHIRLIEREMGKLGVG